MDSVYNESDEDIQTDAQCCSDESEQVLVSQAPRNKGSSYGTRPKVMQPYNSISPAQTSLLYAQSARPMTSSDDKEHLNYLSHMPPDLQEDNIEILIINATSDTKEAEIFQNHLKKDILFYIHRQPRNPRVKLLHEIRHGSMDHLDLAFAKALYVFLYVTKDFCAEPWTLLQGQACLTEAIHDQNKQWCVVPIHTTSKKKQCYRLPMMLSSLRPINYWNGGQDQFYIEGVKKLLESKAGLLLQRERILDEDRRNHFIKNRSEWLKDTQYIYSTKLSHDSDSIINAGAVYHTDECTYTSMPGKHSDKALPDESVSAVVQRMEAIEISEEQPLSSNNDLHVNIRNSATSSSEGANQEVSQKPASSFLNTSSFDVECLQHNTTFTVNSNNSSDIVGQATPTLSNLIAREPDSSIVVDGPANEEPPLISLQQNPVPRDSQQRMAPSTTSSFPAHLGFAPPAPTGAAQNILNGIPTAYHHPSAMGMHNPILCGFPGYGNYFIDSMGRPMIHNQVMQPQNYNPNYVYNPHLQNRQLHQYSSTLNNMQDLYLYANPVFFHNAMSPPSWTNEPTSYSENSQMSRHVNAYSLSDNSLTSSLSAGVSLPSISSQVPMHLMPTMNRAPVQSQPYSHVTPHPPTSVPLTRQHVQTAPATFAQQMQPHLSYSDEQETQVRGQLGTGQTISGYNTQPTANSSEAISGVTSGAANSVIQHVHHHHHQKKIIVTKATNVLIGDKSTFMNKEQSSDVVAHDDYENSGDSYNEDNCQTRVNESSTQNSDRARGPSPKTRTNVAAAEAPNVSDVHVSGNERNNAKSIGFAECLSPASSRQPVEISEFAHTSEVKDKSQTYCKQLY